MIHELKCWPDYFEALRMRQKSFEIRRNDRIFAEGDVLVLREWNPKSSDYTGRQSRRKVVYLTHFPEGLRDGYVCMGIE